MSWRSLYRRFGLSLKYGFRVRKPRLLARLAWNGLRILGGRRVLLRTVDFAPTYECNFHCEHCFAAGFRGDDKRRRMTVGDYRRCAEQAMALGAVHFAFQGGEPLVLDNLEEIIGACYPDRNVIAVTTNATLLTISRVHSLRKAGVDLFTISLDSGNPEDHDSFRRHPGAYNKVMEAVRIAREEGVNVTFNAVVSHNNVHSEGLLSLIRMTAGMGVKLNLLYAVPIGEWMNRKDILLTSEDVRCLDRLFESYCHLRRDLDANYQVFGCGAMKEVLYIDCYGDVMPCPYIHASIGNVLEEPLAAIWQRGQTIDHFKAYVPICLAAEDPHFIAEHLSATHEAGRLPVEGARMFPELKASSGDRRS